MYIVSVITYSLSAFATLTSKLLYYKHNKMLMQLDSLLEYS